ncbi:MAG: S-layer homology domain-containing protein [Oscillospiraceae bacterium]|nr:S-layer homology domain-containing protein [Oscillospiraceae bacterium]
MTTKRTLWKRFLALGLALLLILSPLPPRASAEEAPAADTGLVLESSALTPFAAGAKTDGEAEKINDTFTILWSAKSKVDSSAKTWDDGYESGQRINFGGKAATDKNSIQISLDGPATVKVWWVQGGDDHRQMGLLNADGQVAAVTEGEYVKNSPYYSELSLEEGGVYYLGGVTNNNNIYKVEVVPAAVTHTLESKLLEPFSASEANEGKVEKIDDFFTILWSAKSKVDSSSKTWDDGYESGQRINFGGKAATDKNSIRFETTGAATVKVWWVQGGDDNREMVILDGEGAQAAITSGTYTKNTAYISELTLENAGTWYLGGATNNNYIFKVEVTTGSAEKPPRADWNEVAAPEITGAAVEGGKINVTVKALVGYDGADKVTVTMKDAAGNELASLSSGAYKEEHVLSFSPADSGAYSFSVAASREEEEDHLGQDYGPVDFVFPLEAPYITICANNGGGAVALEWDPVHEAEGYEVAVKDSDMAPLTVTECAAELTGLTVGETYTITVAALRGDEKSAAAEVTITVTAEAEARWSYAAFGTGVDTKNNGSEGNANEGSVRVWNTGGKGKLVPASTDGLAFYYTAIDPKTQNFKLTATASVNSWTYSNGQEGFGLMAADAVGKHGDSTTFWNNSYMAVITKVEYTAETGKYSMKLGVGSQEKVGVTPENINEAHQLDDMSVYSSTMRTLETSCADAGMAPGTYNLVGKYTNNPGPDGTIAEPRTEFPLTLEKNNTGYFVSYTDPAGVTHTEKYYDTEALNHLDTEAVYVGFFASRNADVTFKDIQLSTSNPETDPPAEDRPVTYVDPSYLVESASIANSADYELVFYGNADGKLVVKDASGAELYNGPVTAKEKIRIPATLKPGKNDFSLVMTPDPEFKPSQYERLSSYEAVTLNHSVNYSVNDAKIIYVSPEGSAEADGLTKQSPTKLEIAVQKAIPGQTIYLLEGTYTMSGKLILERGINGTEAEPICLFADPEAAARPVIDFGLNSAGIVLASDWWHLKGFDVTRTANGEKGIQVSGSHNVLELLETYKNGNTGVQISRYKGSDTKAEWPSDNLILNCTSYLNADRGYEDADGFAAKLTIGEGNVFDGCISHHNADDGWDLYAKIENGPIGKVVIRNSVAYKNGYILDEAGNEINAGNGNGFKMGGESIPGGHTLINSVSFANKSKGIDSNSCPDIKAYRSTSFDNESYNVAFYTNTAVNTDYAAEGVISFKKSNTVAENIKPVGNQDQSKIYGESNYYYRDGKFQNSVGAEVQEDWFVSLDTAAAINGGITRNADGSINMNGYLELTDKAPAEVGARLDEYEERPFEDVAEGRFYYQPVRWALEQGITKGVDETHFAPSQDCTRAQVVTFLWRAMEKPAATITQVPFTDVKKGSFYYKAMLWAVESKITTGTGDASFAPNDPCTRGQVVTFLWRAAGKPQPKSTEHSFTDVKKGAFYYKAMLWALEQGITTGTTETTFEPAKTCTRGEIVTFLYRALGQGE